MRLSHLPLFVALLGFVTLLQAQEGPAPDGCPITRAIYAAKSDPRVSARFVALDPSAMKGWLSTLALSIQLPGAVHHDFLFDAGSARFISLISTLPVDAAHWTPPDPDGGVRPMQSLTYFALDRGERFIDTVPTSGSSAPWAIFVPDLSEALWYRATPRFDLPNTLFVYARCASIPPAR